MGDRAALAARFAGATEFTTSPLYRALGPVVAADDHLLDLAAQAPPGVQPTFLLLGAVHRLLLGGVDHELAAWYPSVVGAAARSPEGAGPALRSFGREHAEEIAELVATRLVQTNVVARALALQLGLALVGRQTGGPVHLVEAGASAGVHLRVDRYAYQLGHARGGDPASTVRVRAAWRGADRDAAPPLDGAPPLASATGIDLHPLDATDPEDRAWLTALVWPENHHERLLLDAALAVVAADPPLLLSGDAVDWCPAVGVQLPTGETRVAFHVATRMHVPEHRRPAFDAAVDALGATGPLFLVTMEPPFLTVRDPAGVVHRLARVDGHVTWAAPP